MSENQHLTEEPVVNQNKKEQLSEPYTKVVIAPKYKNYLNGYIHAFLESGEMAYVPNGATGVLIDEFEKKGMLFCKVAVNFTSNNGMKSIENVILRKDQVKINDN